MAQILVSDNKCACLGVDQSVDQFDLFILRRMQACCAVDGSPICQAEVSRAGSQCVFVNHNDRLAEPQGMTGGVGGHSFEETV